MQAQLERSIGSENVTREALFREGRKRNVPAPVTSMPTPENTQPHEL